MTSTLELRSATASRLVRSRVPFGRPRLDVFPYDDWIIDGIALRDLVGVSPGGRHPTVIGVPEISYLIERSAEAVEQLDRLLGDAPGDFEDGRVALLVCAFDWSVECGALSAELVIGPGVVQWRYLGWQDPCEPAMTFVEPALTIDFDRTSYEGLLREARRRHQVLAAGAGSKRHTGATWG